MESVVCCAVCRELSLKQVSVTEEVLARGSRVSNLCVSDAFVRCTLRDLCGFCLPL